MFMEAALTARTTQSTDRPMGRPPLGMKEIKVQFPAEMLEEIDALVGDKGRSKFIRAATAGALAAARFIKTGSSDDNK